MQYNLVIIDTSDPKLSMYKRNKVPLLFGAYRDTKGVFTKPGILGRSINFISPEIKALSESENTNHILNTVKKDKNASVIVNPRAKTSKKINPSDIAISGDPSTQVYASYSFDSKTSNKGSRPDKSTEEIEPKKRARKRKTKIEAVTTVGEAAVKPRLVAPTKVIDNSLRRTFFS